MYYFNRKLFQNIKEVLNLSYTSIGKKTGFGTAKITDWVKNQNMTVSDFVLFLNTFRLSMGDFLTIKEDVPVDKKKEVYVTPIETWEPVQWFPERLTDIFEIKNAENVTSKSGLAKMLGYAEYKAVDRWMQGTMKLNTFIEMLNKLHLDAKLFLEDSNKVIECPTWGAEVVSAISDMQAENERMKVMLKEKDGLIVDLQARNKELRAENASLKKLLRSPIAAEPAVSYSLRRREYSFNIELWRALPDIFGMTGSDFCRLIDLPRGSLAFDNVSVDTLIRACNELRISITHFFPPKGEPVFIQHRTIYEISRHIFQPIEDRSENLEIILKKQVSGITVEKFSDVTGYNYRTVKNFSSKKSNKRSVLGIVHICNSIGLPISVFIHDPNYRGMAPFAGTLNETLAENCIAMYKELEELKSRIK